MAMTPYSFTEISVKSLKMSFNISLKKAENYHHQESDPCERWHNFII